MRSHRPTRWPDTAGRRESNTDETTRRTEPGRTFSDRSLDGNVTSMTALGDEHRSEQPGRGIDRGEEQRVIDDAGPQPMPGKQKPGTHRRRGRVSKRSNHHQDCEQPQHPHQRPESPVVRGKHVKKLARSERHIPRDCNSPAHAQWAEIPQFRWTGSNFRGKNRRR